LKQSNVIIKESRTSFLRSYKKEEILDDKTFNFWKNELQKELPTFWESMNNSPKR